MYWYVFCVTRPCSDQIFLHFGENTATFIYRMTEIFRVDAEDI